MAVLLSLEAGRTRPCLDCMPMWGLYVDGHATEEQQEIDGVPARQLEQREREEKTQRSCCYSVEGFSVIPTAASSHADTVVFSFCALVLTLFLKAILQLI